MAYKRRRMARGKWRVSGLKRYGKLIAYRSKRTATKAKRATGVSGRIYKVR